MPESPSDLLDRIRLGEDHAPELAHSGRRPEYRLLGDSELLLTIFAAGPDESGYTGGTDDGVG